MYEVLYYSGEIFPPVYYLIDGVEGFTPEEALMNNMERLIEQVRDLLGLDSDLISNQQVQSALYVVRRNGLFPAHTVLLDSSAQ